MSRRWKIFTIVGLLGLIADQATKIWARASLPTFTTADGRVFGRAVEVIPNFWDWRLAQNPGASFSLFGDTAGARVFLSVIGFVAIAVILWMVKKSRDDQTAMAWGLGLVIGGALGNLADRVIFGKVTDFVVWRYYDAEWPTFNIADVTLVVGVGLLFLAMARESKLEAQREADEKADQANQGKGASASASARKAGMTGKKHKKKARSR